ncbi:fumarylacetoacetate hydrolase family protein [Microbacterium oryzae]|uniref:Fumarylacetoacetate hydrolase family protein n=1 Tax=Microbacterium oryzae TaxID=743009 RepID=A0A6I6DZL9_9MICO|nr:fumarylacetoacetate hydrolase family protein [Microbacterium oryzae]QGU27404.1 fumarylacetoacetate hydrolase family protein [Microbacterium oryzae]
MRLARIATADGPRFATSVEGGWQPVADPFTAFAAGSPPAVLGAPVADAELLAPTAPAVIVGIGQPASPGGRIVAWLKSPRSVVASGVDVIARRDAGRVVVEGEVALVIGRDTAGLTVDNAAEYVLGVTAVNDVSSPDREDPKNFEVKGGRGYTPLGPWIETEFDLDRVDMSVRIDGVERVRTGSHELAASAAECLAYVTHWVELGPGDIVMTGAPRSAFAIEPEALVEIDVAGVPLRTRFR